MSLDTPHVDWNGRERFYITRLIKSCEKESGEKEYCHECGYSRECTTELKIIFGIGTRNTEIYCCKATFLVIADRILDEIKSVTIYAGEDDRFNTINEMVVPVRDQQEKLFKEEKKKREEDYEEMRRIVESIKKLPPVQQQPTLTAEERLY